MSTSLAESTVRFSDASATVLEGLAVESDCVALCIVVKINCQRYKAVRVQMRTDQDPVSAHILECSIYPSLALEAVVERATLGVFCIARTGYEFPKHPKNLCTGRHCDQLMEVT